MDREIPFCPLCQASLLEVECVRLICNHIYCRVCVEKIMQGETYVCYFDGVVSRTVMNLIGLKQQLIEAASKTNAGMLGPAIESQGIRFEKVNIPCKFSGCGPRCPYDHTGKFYRKAECAFGMTCPNMNKCIFKHTASLPIAAPAAAVSVANFSSYHSGITYCLQCGQVACEAQCLYCSVYLETCNYCGTSGNLRNFRQCQHCQAWRMYCAMCQVWGEWGAYYCSHCQAQLC